jgi:hypothetical protein
MLPNVGREGETYLQYIISHYTTLPDVVVFTQARISDYRAAKGKNDVNFLLHLKNEALAYSKSKHGTFHGKNADFLKIWNIKDGNYYLKDNYKNNTPQVFIEWFKTHIQKDFPIPFHVYMKGIFAVKKRIDIETSH